MSGRAEPPTRQDVVNGKCMGVSVCVLFCCCRSDRDQHIDVMRENIASEKLDNFDKKSLIDISSLGEPYDFQSIMHYSAVLCTDTCSFTTMSGVSCKDSTVSSLVERPPRIH